MSQQDTTPPPTTPLPIKLYTVKVRDTRMLVEQLTMRAKVVFTKYASDPIQTRVKLREFIVSIPRSSLHDITR